MSFYTEEDWLRDAVESIQRLGLAERADVVDARTIDFITRKDAVERRYQGDWIKYVMRGLPALERMLQGQPSYRDSGSDRNGENSRSEVEGEASQNGAPKSAIAQPPAPRDPNA